ncbi:MAG TPA: DUF5615 family PIN-like protein [Pyrinomonadaceae bacterium]|nr:DUF5615 family PIN-like protein [Pyrinomonadaceae bacterium]
MKLLLDECTPRRLRRDFPGHQVFTVEDAGLKGLKNGDLLRAAAAQFDVLITVDRKLSFQQNIAAFEIAVVVLIAKPNRYPELKLLTPKVLEALENIHAGQTVRIGSL